LNDKDEIRVGQLSLSVHISSGEASFVDGEAPLADAEEA
jgi:predicted component of type VI protein secretion system